MFGLHSPARALRRRSVRDVDDNRSANARPIFEPLEDRRLLSVSAAAAGAAPVSLGGTYTGAFHVRQGQQPATRQRLTLNVTSSAGGTLSGDISAPAIGADTFTGTLTGRQFALTFSGDETGTVTGRVGRGGRVLVGSLADQTDGSTGRFRVRLSKIAVPGLTSETGAGASALFPDAPHAVASAGGSSSSSNASVAPVAGIPDPDILPPGVGSASGSTSTTSATAAAGSSGTGTGTGSGSGSGTGTGSNSGSTGTGAGSGTNPGTGASNSSAPVPSMVGAFNGQFNGKMTGNTPGASGGTVNFPNGPHRVTLIVDSQDADGGFTGTMSIQDVGDFPIQGYIGFPIASEVRIILTGGDQGSGALKGKLIKNNQVLISIRRPFTIASQGVTMQGQVTLNRV